MFIGAIFFNTLASYLLASIFGEFLIIFVAFFALVVLNMEILSLFCAISEKGAFILSFLNFLITFLIFKKKKAKFLKPSFDIKRFKNALLLDKSLLILFLCFLLMLIISLFLALSMPVLEPDSQTYHFLRAFQFFSQKSLSHFETNDIRALIMPINSEVFYSWLLLFKKNFHGYGILSFMGFSLVIFSLWSIFEKFKFSYRKRLFAIFLFSSFSCVIIQIPSLQTDMLVGAFLLCGFCLFTKNSIYFSSLCLALACGIKSTGIMAIISFFVCMVLFEKLIEKTKSFEKIKKFSLFFILNFLVFSSYNYILNLIHFHSPLSNKAAYLGHRFWGGFRGYIANLVHFFFQSFDFTGFKWGYYLNNEILGFKKQLFNFIHIDPLIGCNVVQDKVNIISDEQTVGFGILGFIVFLPALAVSFLKIFFNKNKKTILCFIFALAFLINILVLARATAYMVYSIRFIVAYVAFSSVILINVYRKKSFLKPFILFFCIFYMTLLPLHNRRMPFFKAYDLLKKNNFNFEKFEIDAYEGNFITVSKIAPSVYKTILEKYPSRKNIAFIKKLSSSVLYLKKLKYQGYNVVFLSPGNADIENLKKYDLVILEDKVQNDNVFNPWQIDKKYKVVNNDIIFDSNKNLNCYWIYTQKEKDINAQGALERMCFTYQYLILRKEFKNDYVEEIIDIDNQNETKTFIYYFINQIKD